MSITCNECGYNHNPDGSKFCDACGSDIPTTSAELENLRHELLASQRLCLELMYRSDSYLHPSELDSSGKHSSTNQQNYLNPINTQELNTMAVICNECGYDQNPEGAEFCDACGSELPATPTTPDPATEPTVIQPPEPTTPPPPPSTPDPRKTVDMTAPPDPDPITPPTPTVGTVTPARLISKTAGAPIPEFFLDDSSVVGIFDPDMGPVEIDLENFPGGDTVSRAHAEIYPEGGDWKVKDLGSTNGIFIKPSDQTRYGARITAPQTLNPGDEVAFGKVRFLFETA